MHPIPCAHCGFNFMRQNLDPDSPKLCNNCILREKKRTIKKEEIMTTIDILITCPRQDQIEIEEYCINEGIDFTKYFLSLHYAFRDKTDLFDLPKTLGKDKNTFENCYEEDCGNKISKKKVKSKK